MAKYRIVEERIQGVVRYSIQQWKPVALKQNWRSIFTQKYEWLYGWSDLANFPCKTLKEAEEQVAVFIEADEEAKNNYRKPVKEYG